MAFFPSWTLWLYLQQEGYILHIASKKHLDSSVGGVLAACERDWDSFLGRIIQKTWKIEDDLLIWASILNKRKWMWKQVHGITTRPASPCSFHCTCRPVQDNRNRYGLRPYTSSGLWREGNLILVQGNTTPRIFFSILHTTKTPKALPINCLLTAWGFDGTLKWGLRVRTRAVTTGWGLV